MLASTVHSPLPVVFLLLPDPPPLPLAFLFTEFIPSHAFVLHPPDSLCLTYCIYSGILPPFVVPVFLFTPWRSSFTPPCHIPLPPGLRNSTPYPDSTVSTVSVFRFDFVDSNSGHVDMCSFFFPCNVQNKRVRRFASATLLF